MTQPRLSALKLIAVDFLEGRLQPLEAAVALAPFEDSGPASLKKHLTAMIAVASETDHIPLGDRRAFWHPDVRAKEDEKHDEAQAWAEPMVRETCEALAKAL
jgi:hypothetical protein